MDRQIVYPGQILPETTLLQMTKDAMIGSAKLAAAVLGTSTIANGFVVTPTGPASLQVVVAPGEIYALTNIDSLAFSTLPADTTHSILKQGILLDGVTLSCPAPTTTGQSTNYLIQVTYQDQDSTPVLLPYYNSANPAMPYSGMGNNGLTQNTIRKGVAIAQVKAGASAATGSQVTPAPDSGYIGLYVVSVAFGQTIISSGNIAQYSGAPLLPSGIVPAIQSSALTSAQDIGTAGAYKANYSPSITTLSNNMVLEFEVLTANPGAATFSPNGVTAWPIIGSAHAALQGGELIAGGKAEVIWHSTLSSWVLLGCTGGATQVGPATKPLQAVQLQQVGHGQCRLAVASATSLKLSQFNGQNVIVNGVPLQIPAAGVSVSNTGLAAGTLYYAYLSGTTVSPVLSLSVTSHVTNSNGIEVKSGDPTQTLVGMVYTSGSTPGQFVDSQAQRFCLNWFNRRDISASTNGSGFTITTGTEVSSTLRNYFLTWGDENVSSIVTGEVVGNTTASRCDIVILVDSSGVGVQPPGFGRTTGSTFGSSAYAVSLTQQARSVLSEGLHYTTAYSYVTTGNGNYSNISIDTDIRG